MSSSLLLCSLALTTVFQIAVADERAEPLLKLERIRAGCRACPAYEVTLWPDGSVIYIGNDFVNIHGAQRSQLSSSQLNRIKRAAEALQMSRLQPSYIEAGSPDSSVVRLRVWQDGRTTSVRFQPYVGNAPVALRDFADLIDSTVGTRKWICPVPEFNEIVCPKQ